MAIWQPKICLIGDSTMINVENWLYPMTKGSITNLGIWGGNTAGQKAAWLALSASDRAAFDYVVIQIGLNDLDTGGMTAAELIPLVADLFATVRADIKSSCQIISSTMTPCRGTIGDAAYVEWLIVNEAYRGDGSTPFDGDVFASYHTTKLDDGDGYLNETYNSGDDVHPTDAGREVCADDYREYINYEYYQ